MNLSKICLPTRPQPDTIVAIFILRKFGRVIFPGIDTCGYAIISNLSDGKTEREYLAEGVLLIDVGGGIFDHHGKDQKTTASRLVAEALGIQNDRTLSKLLAYAERDDFYGKGTQSDDPLDKAFGLSGLVGALNKMYSTDITKVIDSVLPLLEAHYFQEHQRVKELPLEVEQLKKNALFEESEVMQKKNKLKVCFITSDNVSLPGYLRATDGGKYDVVVQRRTSGHVNILTKPLKRPDLRDVAKLVRAKEFELIRGIEIEDKEVFRLPGRNKDTPMWYFDPATNSLQNGGVNPNNVISTQVSWEDMKLLVKEGLESADA